MRSVHPALPLALVFGTAVAARALHRLDPLQDLRIAYAGLLTATVWGSEAIARRRGRSLPRWIGGAFALFTAFVLLVPVLDLYRVTRLTNRFEHFGGFSLLGAGMLAFARTFARTGRLGAPLRVLLLLIAWSIGWANEAIEYLLGAGGPFFTEDTVLDLIMNTSALLTVGVAWHLGTRRSAPRS